MKRLGAIASALVLSTAVASPLAAQTAIGSLGNTKGITITGEVSEVFGNEFVLSDDSGRVLVETGANRVIEQGSQNDRMPRLPDDLELSADAVGDL